MDYALGNSKGEWVKAGGRVVTYSSMDAAKEKARAISLKPNVSKVYIGRVTWAKDYQGKKYAIKTITAVGTMTKGTYKAKAKRK